MAEPTAILKNTATGRFHPIVFRYAPTPSDDGTGPSRYKSRGHHTDGFDTLDEARSFIESKPELDAAGALYEWDGEDVPAMVIWLERKTA
jgi:hypothetical protein